MILKNSLIPQNYTYIEHEDATKYSAPHHFKVREVGTDSNVLSPIDFQEGPIKECGVNGCANEDLLAIVLCRLEHFQHSEFSCRENALAITKIEEALMWLRKRTVDREQRQVEGTSKV